MPAVTIVRDQAGSEFVVATDLGNATTSPEFTVASRMEGSRGILPLQGTVAVTGTFGAGCTVTLQQFIGGTWHNTLAVFTTAGGPDFLTLTENPGTGVGVNAVAWPQGSKYRFNVVGGDGTTSLNIHIVSPLTLELVSKLGQTVRDEDDNL